MKITKKKRKQLEERISRLQDHLADSGHMGQRMKFQKLIYETELELGIDAKKPFWMN